MKYLLMIHTSEAEENAMPPDEIGRVMATPEFKKKAADLGAAADYLSPAQLGELAQTDLARWAEVAKASKIVAD